MRRDRAEQKIKNLVGSYIEIGRVEHRNHSNIKKIANKKQWLVTAAYPHSVLCIRTNPNTNVTITESFGIGTLIENGIIQ